MPTDQDDDLRYYLDQEALSGMYFANKAKAKQSSLEKGRETLDYLRRLLQTEKPTET